jgi:broad specificity phosphatase PhoE
LTRPTRIHLVRHGRVEDAWRGRIYGDLEVGLAPEGEEEARRAALRLSGVSLAAVVSSGLARAEFGAALLRSGRGLPRRDEPDLREIDRGGWRGSTFGDVERAAPGSIAAWRGDPAFRPPGGESLADLLARVRARLDALAAEFAGLELAVVAHSWVGRVAACAALDLGPEAAHRFDLPTGGLVVLDWPPDPSGGLRPSLAAFAADAPPPRAERWFRGPPPRSG